MNSTWWSAWIASKALHLNDCKKGLGLRVYWHEHVGKGTGA